MDLIKTKMQAQTEMLEGHSGLLGTIKRVYQVDGLIGYYRGFWPPFFGSILYRSAQFAFFEAAFTACEKVDVLRT